MQLLMEGKSLWATFSRKSFLDLLLIITNFIMLKTIGQIAKDLGIKTSALRYYEKEGLISPHSRSESGYRLYSLETLALVRLIQRAQRVGFTLSDIKVLLSSLKDNDLDNEKLIEISEFRFAALEKDLTQKLVLEKELIHFLQDIYHHSANENTNEGSVFGELLDFICPHPERKSPDQAFLDKILKKNQCHLSSVMGKSILNTLTGQHVHIWREGIGYQILVISQSKEVKRALKVLAELEGNCDLHSNLSPTFSVHPEGFLLTADGENAYLFARLFLALQ